MVPGSTGQSALATIAALVDAGLTEVGIHITHVELDSRGSGGAVALKVVEGEKICWARLAPWLVANLWLHYRRGVPPKQGVPQKNMKMRTLSPGELHRHLWAME